MFIVLAAVDVDYLSAENPSSGQLRLTAGCRSPELFIYEYQEEALRRRMTPKHFLVLMGLCL